MPAFKPCNADKSFVFVQLVWFISTWRWAREREKVFALSCYLTTRQSWSARFLSWPYFQSKVRSLLRPWLRLSLVLKVTHQALQEAVGWLNYVITKRHVTERYLIMLCRTDSECFFGRNERNFSCTISLKKRWMRV